MRLGLVSALLALVCVTAPGAVSAADPGPRWPTAEDLATSGLKDEQVACIVRFFHGRLTRDLWLRPYYKLTPREKHTNDAGVNRCVAHAERIAWSERLFARKAGKQFPSLHCVATAEDALTVPELDAIDSRAKWLRAYDAIFRRCGLTGQFYAEVAGQNHVAFSTAARSCANRASGVAQLILERAVRDVTVAQRKAIGGVFDRCVGGAAEEAFYRTYLGNLKSPSRISCAARRVAARATFADLLSGSGATRSAIVAALAACRAVPTP